MGIIVALVISVTIISAIFCLKYSCRCPCCRTERTRAEQEPKSPDWIYLNPNPKSRQSINTLQHHLRPTTQQRNNSLPEVPLTPLAFSSRFSNYSAASSAGSIQSGINQPVYQNTMNSRKHSKSNIQDIPLPPTPIELRPVPAPNLKR